MSKKEGKKEFYPRVEESFRQLGYQYFDGDRDIKGKGRRHANKPDYIAVKGGTIIIGEIKSPSEPPTSGSWRTIQPADSEDFKAVRTEVSAREKAGEISKEVGGHEIIIRGQIPDYIVKINATYELPDGIKPDGMIQAGYTFPTTEKRNVEFALKDCHISKWIQIDAGNEAITFIFAVPKA